MKGQQGQGLRVEGPGPEGAGARTLRQPGLWLFAAVALLLVGCGPDLDVEYGQQQTIYGKKSVNGTSVLADMFRASGHRVTSWNRLSPRLRERADVVVWFVQDYTPLSALSRAWLEEWLFAEPGRTLIVVGRDFNAAPGYWAKMKVGAPPEQSAEVNRRLAEARNDALGERGPLDPVQDSGWFKFDNQSPTRQVRSLAGDAQWRAGVDPTKLEIELTARLIVPDRESVRTLLSSAGEALVSRETIGESQLIVVSNGSFLLNLPLVNPEHRKLAGTMIESVGEDRYVYLLETGGEPAILDKEPEATLPTALGLLAIPPWGLVLLHLALLGLMFCFSRFPIFGVPKRLPAASTSDFGEHISALGELLAKTRNTDYAQARLAQYQQTMRPDLAARNAAQRDAGETLPPSAPAGPLDDVFADKMGHA